MKKGKFIPWIAILAALLTLSGCSELGTSQGNAETSVSVGVSHSAEASQPSEEAEASPEDSVTPVETPAPDGWTVHVNETIPVEIGGISYSCTLVLAAVQTGGANMEGTYTGAMFLSYGAQVYEVSGEVDISGSASVFAYTSDLSLDIIPYDKSAFAAYGKKGPGFQDAAGSYDAMALLSPLLDGAGSFTSHIGGLQGESANVGQSASAAAELPVKIGIRGSDITVSLPSFRWSRDFTGTVSGGVDEAQYSAAISEINERIAVAMAGAQAAEDATDVSDYVEDLPDSFPEEIPMVEDAEIVDVYMSGSTVGITFGTNTAYSEVLDYYDDLISQLPEGDFPIEDGIEYSGEVEGYENVTVIIQVDPSGSYDVLVTIEVTY